MPVEITLDHRLTYALSTQQFDTIFQAIQTLEGLTMAAIDDLKQAITNLQTQVATDMGALEAALQTEFQQVRDLLAAASQDPAITEATAHLSTMSEQLHQGITAAVDALNAPLPPEAPTP